MGDVTYIFKHVVLNINSSIDSEYREKHIWAEKNFKFRIEETLLYV